MIKKYLLLTLAALLLTACGGSSDKPLFDEKNTGTEEQNNNATDENPADSDVSTGTEIANPRLGVGTGSAFESGQLELSVVELSAGGTTKITANIVDNDNANKKIVSQSYKVIFTSTCSELEPSKADFNNPEITTASGNVSVIYTAKGCSGEDIISASLFAEDELKHTAIAKVTIAEAEVNTISFVETESPILAIKTMANPVLPTHTTVSFKVIDKFGDPISDKEVSFFLGAASGDVSLAKESTITDNSGIAKAIVNSGTTHTNFVVTATTLASNGNTIGTSSQTIAVTTSLPRQDHFSISASVFNPAAYNVDGVEVAITVRANDAFGNFAPEGTVVNLTAESGGIDSSCTLDAQGSCSATWISNGTRPGEYNASLGRPNDRIGMTTILAYTLGEAGFTDKNADNIFDIGESFVSYPEPFRDDDWSLTHTENEFFQDTDFNGSHSGAPATYQGALCSDAAINAGHCASLMHVRDQLRIIQTFDGNPLMLVYECNASGVCTPTSNLVPAGGEFYVVLQDRNGNMAPAGTTLTVKGEGYTVRGDDGAVNNNVGLLDGSEYDRGLTGLPEFGMLYRVEYKPDTTPEVIELEANNDGQITRVYLE